MLQVLRRMGRASKADIARVANLTNAAVGSIVSSLEKQNLIVSGKKRKKGQRGQPATLLHLNPTGAYGIGVRLERNSIQTVLIDFDGNILSKLSHEAILPQPNEALTTVCRDIETILATLPKESASRLTGIGLAKPYNLGSWLKELDLPENSFKKWDSYDFSSELEKRTGIPVQEENDGTAAAIAELFYGAGREIDNFLYLFFGPAIGGGIVLNGDIVRGHTGNAADVGIMPVEPSTLKTAIKPSGEWDILLNRASLNSLRRHLHTCYPEESFDTRTALENSIDK
ncbi:MAG: ROK family protein, partial [Spirochaetaceae bacterium]